MMLDSISLKQPTLDAFSFCKLFLNSSIHMTPSLIADMVAVIRNKYNFPEGQYCSYHHICRFDHALQYVITLPHSWDLN